MKCNCGSKSSILHNVNCAVRHNDSVFKYLTDAKDGFYVILCKDIAQTFEYLKSQLQHLWLCALKSEFDITIVFLGGVELVLVPTSAGPSLEGFSTKGLIFEEKDDLLKDRLGIWAKEIKYLDRETGVMHGY